MTMTIREVMTKLSEIELAINDVDRLMSDDKNPYTGDNPKDAVMDLLEEYMDRIKDTKVNI